MTSLESQIGILNSPRESFDLHRAQYVHGYPITPLLLWVPIQNPSSGFGGVTTYQDFSFTQIKIVRYLYPELPEVYCDVMVCATYIQTYFETQIPRSLRSRGRPASVVDRYIQTKTGPHSSLLTHLRGHIVRFRILYLSGCDGPEMVVGVVRLLWVEVHQSLSSDDDLEYSSRVSGMVNLLSVLALASSPNTACQRW